MRPIRIALAGDTMLGRGVGDRLARGMDPRSLFDPALVRITRSADVVVLNLECCISDRGDPWPEPRKPFFFRAPPVAVEALRHLGVDCVTLANNHALDFGAEALFDTLAHLARAGIACVGAGGDQAAARAPATLPAGAGRLGVIGLTDHPADYAATAHGPGVAFADLRAGLPAWLRELIAGMRPSFDALLVTPHWGPNMSRAPVPHVRHAMAAMLAAGATLVAGHSAHVFHGVVPGGLYDLGDFIDDYAVDPVLRNDLGLLFLVDLDEHGPIRLEAVPLRLEFAHTGLANRADADWIRRRFTEACRDLGTVVHTSDGRPVVERRADQAAFDAPR